MFRKTEEEHFKHLKQVKMVLEQEQFYGNVKKCSFFTLDVVFLDYRVSAHGIQVNQSKVDATKSWPVEFSWPCFPLKEVHTPF